jgi:hypothetical protein
MEHTHELRLVLSAFENVSWSCNHSIQLHSTFSLGKIPDAGFYMQATSWAGLQHLIKYYKSCRFDPDIGLPRSITLFRPSGVSLTDKFNSHWKHMRLLFANLCHLLLAMMLYGFQKKFIPW